MNTIENLKSLSGADKAQLLGMKIKENCSSKLFLQLMQEDLMQDFIPELSHTKGLPQNPAYHCYTVDGHIFAVIKAAEEYHPGNVVMALTGWFHDNKKGDLEIRTISKKGQPQDIGHEKAGVEPTYQVLDRFRYFSDPETAKIAEDVLFLVEFHGLDIALNNADLTPEETVAQFKDKSVKKAINKIADLCDSKEELVRKFKLLFDFKKLDAYGFAPEFGNRVLETIKFAEPRFMAMIEQENY
jgi:UTP:GlnB (protein PII) uridylyltransferase